MSLQCRGRGWLTEKLRRARALSAAEWLLLIQASSLLLAVEPGLKLLPFKTLLALLQQTGAAGQAGRLEGAVSPDRVAYLVEVASRYHVLKPTCLKKALVLYRLLRRRGVEVELVIGVRRAEERLEAHAWVQHGRRAVGGGREAERHAPLLASMAEYPEPLWTSKDRA